MGTRITQTNLTNIQTQAHPHDHATAETAADSTAARTAAPAGESTGLPAADYSTIVPVHVHFAVNKLQGVMSMFALRAFVYCTRYCSSCELTCKLPRNGHLREP